MIGDPPRVPAARRGDSGAVPLLPPDDQTPDDRRFDEDLPADQAGERGSGATITPYRDGPLIVRGNFALVDQDGAQIDPGRETIALCRCGKSGIKPFCDGSHKRSGFSAPSAPSRPRPAAQLRRED